MGKHSKRSRRRLQQSGLGGGGRVVARLPKGARQLPRAPQLDPATELRLRCVEHAQRHGVAAAVQVFGRSRATIYRWRKRYDPVDLRSLQPHSRRPTQPRRQWTAAQEAAVPAMRGRFPRSGKAKLHHLLHVQGMHLPASTIGRILAALKRRHLLSEPDGMRVHHRRSTRPYATRVPTDKRQPTAPGALIQLDTLHLRPLPGIERRQFTAAAFLTELLDRFPFPIQAVQVDGGSEFMVDFETACQAKQIALYVLPPRSPKLNGRVERLNSLRLSEMASDGEGAG